jgi:hypothetical protein
MIGTKNDCMKFLIDAPDKQYEVKEHHEKRSLDANAYYWKLLTELAGKLHTSKTELHNIMLQRYGQPYIDGNGKIVSITVRADVDMTRIEGHWEPYSSNDTWAAYRMLRGSHTYNTKEMSQLIDGLVSECKECGIETLTPIQLSQLRGYEK